MITLDELYMRRCLQLARCGGGSTSPNPMVGAVVVCDGRIIGEGYHIRAGMPHAEVNAVRSIKAEDRHLLPLSTIYVTLEPCSHYGKTPPCCDMIISHGIKRVVIGSVDSNAAVNGSGIARMRAAGIEVVTGVLEGECRRLNGAFFTMHELHRPFVTLKWAQSADGYIDAPRDAGETALHVSTPVSLAAVHKLRAMHDAILVGRRTALLDNPSLNLRYWAGRAPLRLVIDRLGELPSSLNLFDGSVPTVVYTAHSFIGKFGKNVQQVELDFSSPVLPQIMSHLHSINVGSLLVEGGRELLQSFIDSSLWDAVRVEVNESLVAGGGVSAPMFQAACGCEETLCGGNRVLCYRK